MEPLRVSCKQCSDESGSDGVREADSSSEAAANTGDTESDSDSGGCAVGDGRSVFRSNSSLRGPRVATTCGAGGGDHSNVYGPPGVGQLGSILCCYCCEDTPAGPVTKKKCKAQ